jgi:VCBS repeat-containing protein
VTPDDSFTITATDATGKTVTIATINVTPSVANNAPVATLTTAPTVGTINGTTQTSTGKITTTDADGDTAIYPSSVSTTKGGTVTFASDGTFTYTANLSTSVRHAAAKVGATTTDKNDTFSVTVTDGYGGSSTVNVTVPIYAINAAPGTTGGGTSWSGSAFLGTYGYYTGVSNASDSDGDSVTYTVTSTDGSASYNSTSLILSTSGSKNGTVVTITVYDGSYVVSNGVVTSTLSSNSRNYTISRGA